MIIFFLRLKLPLHFPDKIIYRDAPYYISFLFYIYRDAPYYIEHPPAVVVVAGGGRWRAGGVFDLFDAATQSFITEFSYGVRTVGDLDKAVFVVVAVLVFQRNIKVPT